MTSQKISTSSASSLQSRQSAGASENVTRSRSMDASGSGCSASTMGDVGAASAQSSSTTSQESRSQNSPFAMAAMARDRLQISAQQLFKNLEDALGSSRSGTSSSEDPSTSQQAATLQPWESALRTMFSSCTTSADQFTVPDASKTTSPRSSSNPKGASAVVTPGTPTKRKSARIAEPSSIHLPSAAPVVQGGPPQKDLGEHIYAQLFFDDQIRAAKAVSGAARDEGGNHAHSQTNHAVTPPSERPRYLSGPHNSAPLPVSAHASRIMLSDLDVAPELDLTRTRTFDDSISAISAHTLEAMAMANPSVQHAQEGTQSSGPATLFPPEVLLRSQEPHRIQSKQLHRQTREPPAPSAPAQGGFLGAVPSPFLDRHRSPSSNSRFSKNSHSTRTTESSSFDHWQQEDNKFWVEEAARDEPTATKASPKRLTRKVSSASSSSHRKGSRIPPSSMTNPRSPHRHPHDTAPFYSSGAYDFEPLEPSRRPTGAATAVNRINPFHHRSRHPKSSSSEPQFSEI